MSLLRTIGIGFVAASLAASGIGAEPRAATAPQQEEGGGGGRAAARQVGGDGTAEASPAPVSSHGLRVFFDPVSGELTSDPSPEQLRELSKALGERLSRSSEGLVPFVLKESGRGVFLAGRFQSATVVEARPDGTLELRCLSHPEPAQEAPEASAEERPAARPAVEIQ